VPSKSRPTGRSRIHTTESSELPVIRPQRRVSRGQWPWRSGNTPIRLCLGSQRIPTRFSLPAPAQPGSPFSHRCSSNTLRVGRRQPLISPTLGSYFAEAGIALAKSAHVTRMKSCSFRNFLKSSLLTRSISFWRHCAPQSEWSNVAARISSLS